MNTKALTPDQIRLLGLRALAQALGPVGMVQFIQQFEPGSGDYSIERHALIGKDGARALAEKIQKSRNG